MASMSLSTHGALLCTLLRDQLLPIETDYGRIVLDTLYSAILCVLDFEHPVCIANSSPIADYPTDIEYGEGTPRIGQAY